jgi:hypothetical protein
MMSELEKPSDELKSRIENELPGIAHDDYRRERSERLS